MRSSNFRGFRLSLVFLLFGALHFGGSAARAPSVITTVAGGATLARMGLTVQFPSVIVAS